MFDREQQSQEGWELGRDLWSQETWSCRTALLEVFWWAPQTMLLLGVLHHSHSLGSHSPALGRDISPFHFPFGGGAGGLLLGCFTVVLSVPQQSPAASGNRYSGCKINRLTLISGLHSSLLLQSTPIYSLLSPLYINRFHS